VATTEWIEEISDAGFSIVDASNHDDGSYKIKQLWQEISLTGLTAVLLALTVICLWAKTISTSAKICVMNATSGIV